VTKVDTFLHFVNGGVVNKILLPTSNQDGQLDIIYFLTFNLLSFRLPRIFEDDRGLLQWGGGILSDYSSRLRDGHDDIIYTSTDLCVLE